MTRADIARLLSLVMLALLAAALLGWQSEALLAGRLLPLLWLAPLLFPLPGLMRGRRSTYAWTTLLLTGYIALALTEIIALPAQRLFPALILFIAFALFICLVGYLRASRTA